MDSDSHYGLFQSRQTPYVCVGFTINKNVPAHIINALTRTNEDKECIFIDVLIHKEMLVIGSIYPTRSSNMANFINIYRFKLSVTKFVSVWRYEH